MSTVIAFIVVFKSSEYSFSYLSIESVGFPQFETASTISIVNIMQ